MEESIQESSGEIAIPPLLDKAWKYFLFGFLVIAAPIFNFILIDLMKPEWQDGRFASYLYLFLLPKASVWFFPLLIYAILSYILLLWDTEQFASVFMIRLGVYGGVFLALQYSLLSFVASFTLSPASLLIILAYAAPLIFAKLYPWLKYQWDKLYGWNKIVAVGIPVIIIGLMLWGFFFVLAIFGIASPFWSFLISLQASRWLIKHHETNLTLPRGLGIVAWLSAYVFALRFNILKMFELYNSLPTAPPDCYIATAAAKGHPRFVGSQEVRLANGKSMRVNRQLQRLKAAEIAWMGVSAPSHRMMRRMYDVIGKWLAVRIQNPYLADISYLLLKPCELLAVFIIKILLKNNEELIFNIYVKG